MMRKSFLTMCGLAGNGIAGAIFWKRTLLVLRYFSRGLIYCLLALMYSSRLSAAIPSTILYQDANLTIYDDTTYQSETHKRFIARVDLSVVHKAGVKEPILEIRKSRKNGEDYYEYGPSVMEDFRTKLPKLFASEQLGTVTMAHFLADHQLPRKVGSMLNTPRGQAIIQVNFQNKLNGEKLTRQGSWQSIGQPWSPEGWTFYTEGTSDAGLITTQFLNTFAAAELGRYPSDKPTPLENAASLAANAGLESDSASEFGYEKAQLVLKTDNTEYFLVDSELSGRIKLAAVHAVGEEDWLADLDIFPVVVDVLNEGLGFLYSDTEISAFNQQVAPILNKLINNEREVWIYHYLKGKPLPEKPADAAGERKRYPVFVSAFSPLANSKKWKPVYSIRNVTPRVTGNFNSFRTRYSYASTLRYIKEHNRNGMPGAKPAAKTWAEEADEAYRHATPDARARRSNYKLWTQSYWQFFDTEVGRNLIDGLFEYVPLDDNFTSFYRMYFQQYSSRCSAYIKNGKSYRATHKREHRNAFGSWTETISDTTTLVESRFAEKYEYYDDHGAPEETKSPYGADQYFRALQSVQRFIIREECQSPLQMRMQENLYRRSQGLTALTDSTETRVGRDSASTTTATPLAVSQLPRTEVIDNPSSVMNASIQKPEAISINSQSASSIGTDPSIASTSPSSQLIAAPSAPSFPNEMAVDNSVVDFILARTLGSSLSDDLLRGMLISRWQYEHAIATPHGGRFFDKNSRDIYERDLVALLPTFRQWIMGRGQKLPENMYVSINVYADKFKNTVQAVPVKGCFAVEAPMKLAEYRAQFSGGAFIPDSKRMELCNAEMQARMQDMVACIMKNPANKQQCSEEIKNQHAQCLSAQGAESKTAWISPVIQWASSELNERDCGGHSSFSATRQVSAAALGSTTIAAKPSRVAVKFVFDKGIPMPSVSSVGPTSLRLQIRPTASSISTIDRTQNSKANFLAIINASVVSTNYQP